MGFDQYQEPPHESPAATRTFERTRALPEAEGEAIDWYGQHAAFEPAAAVAHAA
jgi:hypothetical protein